MMRKRILVLGALFLALVLTACGGNSVTEELDQKDTNKAEAKTGDKAVEAEEEVEDSDSEDLWTYYDEAKWSDHYNGLKLEVQKVAVTDKAPSSDEEKEYGSAVAVKFKMENTTDGKFTFYPDQAVLVTSTGEQIDMPDMWESDSIGGEIDKGVIKEGNIIWFLERGNAESIEWIKMTFGGHQGDEDNYDAEYKEFEFEISLQ